MLDTTTFYRARFDAEEEIRAEPLVGGYWWGFRNIKGGLSQKCSVVRELKLDRDLRNSMRAIAATANDSGLTFVALLKFADSAGFLQSRRDRIVEMLYVASFTGPGGDKLSALDRDEINKVTEVSAVALDDTGKIFIFAQPLIEREFDFEFFSDQLNYFLQDMLRTAIYLYYT